MIKKYKYSRKEITNRIERFMPLSSKMDSPTIWSHLNQFRIDLLATVPTKECELCLEDSGNHTFDCPRHKRNLNSTPPQLPEIEKIQSVETKRLVQGKFVSSFYITEGGGKFLIDKINELTDRLNLLSQRVCKEK